MVGKKGMRPPSGAAAGCAAAPACPPAKGAAQPSMLAVIGDRLAAAAGHRAELCGSCRARRSNGAGWCGLCFVCFDSAPWRELLKRAPRPDAQLATALQVAEVESRLRRAQQIADPPDADRNEEEEDPAAVFAGMGLSQAQVAEWVADTLEQRSRTVQKERKAARVARAGVGELAIADDGSCQYHAVSVALFGYDHFHRALRAAAAEWLGERGQRFHHAVSPQYLARLRDGAWGDELTLHAMAQVTGARLVVATGEPGRDWVEVVQDGRSGTADRAVCMTLDAVHYNVAVPAEHADLAAACAAAGSLERALARVRAAADAPGGAGLAGAIEGAAAEANRVFAKHPLDMPQLWDRALAAARCPLRRSASPPAAAAGQLPGAPAEGGRADGRSAASSAAQERIRDCAADEHAARLSVERDQGAAVQALCAAADRAARRAAERALSRAESRAADAERRAAAESDARSAAVRIQKQAEERAAKADKKAAAERAACIAAERKLTEARAALGAAHRALRQRGERAPRELAQVESTARRNLRALEDASRAHLAATTELRCAGTALQRTESAAQRQLHSTVSLCRGTLSELEKLERERLAALCAAAAQGCQALSAERQQRTVLENHAAALRSLLADARSELHTASGTAAAALQAEQLRAAALDERAVRAGMVAEEAGQWALLAVRAHAEAAVRGLLSAVAAQEGRERQLLQRAGACELQRIAAAAADARRPAARTVISPRSLAAVAVLPPESPRTRGSLVMPIDSPRTRAAQLQLPPAHSPRSQASQLRLPASPSRPQCPPLEPAALPRPPLRPHLPPFRGRAPPAEHGGSGCGGDGRTRLKFLRSLLAAESIAGAAESVGGTEVADATQFADANESPRGTAELSAPLGATPRAVSPTRERIALPTDAASETGERRGVLDLHPQLRELRRRRLDCQGLSAGGKQRDISPEACGSAARSDLGLQLAARPRSGGQHPAVEDQEGPVQPVGYRKTIMTLMPDPPPSRRRRGRKAR